MRKKTGNSREIQGILRNVSRIYKEIESNSSKITISGALARFACSHISLEHVITDEIPFKDHEIGGKKWNFSNARSHILIFYIRFPRHDFETSHF